MAAAAILDNFEWPSPISPQRIAHIARSSLRQQSFLVPFAVDFFVRGLHTRTALARGALTFALARLFRYPMTYETSTPAIRIARTATQSRRTKDSRLDKQFGHFFEIIFSLSIIAFSLEDFHCSVSVPFYCVP